MASERPGAAYAAGLIENQDSLQAEADRLVERLGLPTMLGRAGRFERLGSSVSGLMVWRDLDLGASCGRLSPERAWETMVPLAAHPRTTQLEYRNEMGRLAPPGLRGYGRYYFVARHRTEGATSGRSTSPCGRRGRRRVRPLTLRNCAGGSRPRRAWRYCGSKTSGTGCPRTPIESAGWTSTTRSSSMVCVRPSSSGGTSAGAICQHRSHDPPPGSRRPTLRDVTGSSSGRRPIAGERRNRPKTLEPGNR